MLHNRLLEILESPVVYLQDADDFIPIVIEMDSIEEKTLKNDKIFNLSLEYRISFNKNSIRI